MSEVLRLDLGSGPRPAEGFRGVDKEEGLTDFEVDFDDGRPWPFEDSSVTELRSSHCIEHLSKVDAYEWVIDDRRHVRSFLEEFGGPDHIMTGGHVWTRTGRRKNTVFHFFDEAFRVIVPGGKFEVRWPSHQNSMSYGDPTHQRFLSGALYLYLNRGHRQARGVDWYNVQCNWVGSVHETTSAKPASTSRHLGLDAAIARRLDNAYALRNGMKHDWNVVEETVMLLTAEKGP